jgi:ornithine lipid hydroxylase
LLRRAFFPGFVTSLAAWAVWTAGGGPARSLGLDGPAGEGAGLVLAILIGWSAVAAAERLLPFRRDWNRSHRDVPADVAYLATGATVHSLAQPVLGLVGAVLLRVWQGPAGRGSWPNSWPLVAQLALALLVAELGHWLFHKVSHERDLVWRVHALHHAAPRLYWLNATRFHPVDLFALIACQTLPLIALGIGAPALAAYAIFTSVYGQLQHGNVDLDTSAFDGIFSTPTLHRWHHANDVRIANANYGAVLILWDRLFGTFHDPGRPFDGRVGLDGLPGFPTGLVDQLLSPVRWAEVHRAPGGGSEG